MIEVTDLYKRYGQKEAVRGISFTVEKGEVIGFLGPNGAGKTTTMRMLTGFLPITSGTARVAGFDVTKEPEQVRRRVGYLPETPPLYHEMKVVEYLRFVAGLRGVPRKERKQRVEEVIADYNLEEVRNTLISRLSKGFRQRVGLAQAILHKPEVLILDEPTSGLDPLQVADVRDVLRKFGENHTVLLSTHILSEIEHLCRRVIIINRGQILAVDTPESLAKRVQSGEQIRLEIEAPAEQAKQALGALPEIAGVELIGQQDGRVRFSLRAVPESDARRAVVRLVASRDWRMNRFEPESLDLENVFMQLAGKEAPQAEAKAAEAQD